MTSFIQRYRTPGTKITSIALAVVLVSQLVLGSLAQAGNHVPNPSANLSQCANGPLATPASCTGSNWQYGNLGTNNSHYAEGQSAPYRVIMENLPTTGTLTLVIEYDITQSSKHAIDYLTSFNRTETTGNDPCSNVSPCSLSGTAAIPAPSSASSTMAGMPTDSFNALPATESAMSLYNAAIAGTGITYVSEGNLNAAAASTQVQIQFTATQSTVVFAWGGHIGSSSDWGAGNSAGAVSGSPYHMRLVSLTDANLGNQDRSLSTAAIVTPPPAPTTGTLIVIKTVTNDDGGSAVPSDFMMNVSGINVSSSSFPGAETGTAVTLDAGAYNVTEAAAPGYAVSYSTDCTGTIAAGETKTCAIINNDIAPALTVIKSVINDNVGQSGASAFTLNVHGTNVSTASFPGSASGTNVTLDAGGYNVTENFAAGYAVSYSADCAGTIAAGETRTCTVTNNDIAPPLPPPEEEGPLNGTLTVVKVVINDNNGTSVVSDFPLFIGQMSVTSGTPVSLPPGPYVVGETGSPDYVASFSGDCDVNGAITLASDDDMTCTITNDDRAPGGRAPQTGTLIVVTKVINDDGGIAMPSSFLMTVGDGISTSSTFGGFDTPGFSMAYAPGAYVVNGSASASYSQSKSANCSGAMLAGQTVTCVVTYDDMPATGGGNPLPPTPPAPPAPPAPQGGGVTDSATAPVPQVLGATDSDLPVTGMPAWTLASIILAAAPFLRRKRA